jgi:hypothetical protein
MNGFHRTYDRFCRRVCGAGFSILLKDRIYFEHLEAVNLSRTAHYRFNLVMKFPRKKWMEGAQAAMTTRNLEPDQWRIREEWRLFSGRRRQLL